MLEITRAMNSTSLGFSLGFARRTECKMSRPVENWSTFAG
jgi:hypothetical protein